jgi:hypothetical protein
MQLCRGNYSGSISQTFIATWILAPGEDLLLAVVITPSH